MKKSYQLKKQELLNSGYNPEKFLDEFNNNWFYEHKKSAADYTEFLALAVNECPESIDLCYALASQLEGQDRPDEAMRYYRQCLQINPACHYAKMRLGLLELNIPHP
jgi:tetratricopeptide (TPR) repeat protein